MKKITILGGGTGTFVSLSGLKNYPYDLSVIVTMMDSGGSTGRLRDQLGVLPPGDLRQCLVALSEAPLFWRKLFLYRFDKGDLRGHNFGNIFLSALAKVTGDYQKVVDTASFILKTKGSVIPVTYNQTHLCVKYANGRILKGEGAIDENTTETSRIVQAYVAPKVGANPKAIAQILKSDYVIIGPGDLYTSIIAVLLISGVAEAIVKTKAKLIYVANLTTKRGQTTNYSALDHLLDLQTYLGRAVDYVIINNGKVPKHMLNWYAKDKEQLVEDDLNLAVKRIKVIRADVVDKHQFVKRKEDEITRSILRHDAVLLAKTINTIL